MNLNIFPHQSSFLSDRMPVISLIIFYYIHWFIEWHIRYLLGQIYALGRKLCITIGLDYLKDQANQNFLLVHVLQLAEEPLGTQGSSHFCLHHSISLLVRCIQPKEGTIEKFSRIYESGSCNLWDAAKAIIFSCWIIPFVMIQCPSSLWFKICLSGGA